MYVHNIYYHAGSDEVSKTMDDVWDNPDVLTAFQNTQSIRLKLDVNR